MRILLLFDVVRGTTSSEAWLQHFWSTTPEVRDVDSFCDPDSAPDVAQSTRVARTLAAGIGESSRGLILITSGGCVHAACIASALIADGHTVYAHSASLFSRGHAGRLLSSVQRQ